MSSTSMKIGELVKHHIKKIFQHCDTIDHEELDRLTNKKYSKNTFDLNYPFCTEVDWIPSKKSVRYWKDVYFVRGKTVRVSSEWYVRNKGHFVKYLINKSISTLNEIEQLTDVVTPFQEKTQTSTKANSRYRGNAIGNSQNLPTGTKHFK